MMDIFKMIVKIVAVVVVTAIATPFLFGFAAGLFDSLSAGYTVGMLVVCIGLFAIGYTIYNGICRAREGTEKQSGGTKSEEP